MSALASSSKRSRGPAAHDVDRLSSLPEPLLHLVMSFLPMPEVVRTSLLSASWRYLWASVPFIHLDYKDFVDGRDERKGGKKRLQKFGDQLLLLRDGTLPLDEARIFINCGCLYHNCCTWIRHAIRHKARLLHVYTEVMFDNRAMVPSQHLKRLRLETVYLDDRFFKAQNFESHVLEHQELESCTVYVARQKISSSSLKILFISRCHLYRDLEICATNLNHLSILVPTFESPRGFVIVTRDLCSLVTAWISLRSGVHGDRDEILDHGILDGLSHVTTLELHAPLPELTLESGLQTCPVFGNLIRLVLGEWCTASDFSPLLFILRRSPILKDLTFKLGMEQCVLCKDAADRDLAPRKESSSGGCPRIERSVIYCGKDDPRVSALVQVLHRLLSQVEKSASKVTRSILCMPGPL